MRLLIIDGYDWMGLYIDNNLQQEGHRITIKNLIRIMSEHNISGKECKYKSLNDKGISWLSDNGFPDNATNINSKFYNKGE